MLARAITLLVLLASLSAPAHARKLVALLIGNQEYAAGVGKLVNPHNDIALLEQALKSLDFEVATVRDAGLAVLHQTINAHVRRVRAAGNGAIGFFYYSGHGAQDATTGTNYLIPVDVASADDSELWDRSLRLTEITRKLKGEAGNATHFVVFDACRNGLKLKKAGSRALLQSKGFVPVREESGMLIAYSTAEGELASDIGAGAGPYAKVLAEEIVKPGIEAVAMFRRVQVRVRAAIGQEPWLGFTALSEVHLAGLDAPKSPAAAALQSQLSEAERAWAVTKDTANELILEAFIRQFGDTVYGAMARVQLEKLKKPQVAIAALPQPKPTLSPSTQAPKDNWHSMIGPERSFTADMPAAPKYTAMPMRTAAGSGYTMHQYLLEQGEVAYVVQTAVYPTDVNVSNHRTNLQGSLDNAAKNMEGGKWASTGWVTHQGFTAVDAIGTRGGHTIRSFSVMKGRQIFTLTYAGPQGSARSADVDRFVASLRIEK